jgi:hypothetical protein
MRSDRGDRTDGPGAWRDHAERRVDRVDATATRYSPQRRSRAGRYVAWRARATPAELVASGADAATVDRFRPSPAHRNRYVAEGAAARHTAASRERLSSPPGWSTAVGQRGSPGPTCRLSAVCSRLAVSVAACEPMLSVTTSTSCRRTAGAGTLIEWNISALCRELRPRTRRQFVGRRRSEASGRSRCDCVSAMSRGAEALSLPTGTAAVCG